MAEQQISMENLYKLRGDVAIAALEGVLRHIEFQVTSLKSVMDQLRVMDSHYELRNNLELDGLGEMVATMRRLRPAETQGRTDKEVLELFGGNTA